MIGGDIDKAAVQSAFFKIKEDMARLSDELILMREEHKKLKEENLALKKIMTNIPAAQSGVDTEMISKIVRETLKNVPPPQPQKSQMHHVLMKKINKNRKHVIASRILTLAEKKSMSVSEIKDMIVDTELLCSKATFYRYVEKMKRKGMVDFIKINEMDVLVKL